MSLLFVCSFLCTLLHAQDPETPGSDHTPTVAIDGLLYKLSKSTLTAMVANGNNWGFNGLLYRKRHRGFCSSFQ